jgi:hypothetical protein
MGWSLPNASPEAIMNSRWLLIWPDAPVTATCGATAIARSAWAARRRSAAALLADASSGRAAVSRQQFSTLGRKPRLDGQLPAP